jgi:hypothetical protein
VAPYVRAVQTASGATAVRIVHSSHRGSRDIEHIGSAHHDAELAVLKAAAPLRMAAGQLEFDFGLDAEASGGPLAITSSRMARLWVALSRAYRVLGFETATGGDEVLRALVWRESSSRPGSWTRGGSSRRPGSTQCRTRSGSANLVHYDV